MNNNINDFWSKENQLAILRRGVEWAKKYAFEAKEDKYPRIGPFYYYRNKIIAPDEFQQRINPATFIREPMKGFIPPGEHRDMWDKHMIIKYPEFKELYNDDHKALPRGRVDYRKENNDLVFFITLDKCLEGKGQENIIKRIYNLGKRYKVEFHYGTMNYHCKDCRKKRGA